MNTNISNWPKDFIFQERPKSNPLCFLQNGTKKAYESLICNDLVFVKEGEEYLAGIVRRHRFNHGFNVWEYLVNTKNGTKWREPQEFKYAT